jgi:hypothetical protein
MAGVKAELSVSLPSVFLLVLIHLGGGVPSAGAQASAEPTKSEVSTGAEGALAAPSITSQPASQTVTAGQTATFAVVAAGTTPLSYQWMRNGAAIAGATSPAYTTPVAAAADNGAQFSVTISNAAGSSASSSATLTVAAAAARPRESTASNSLENPRGRISRIVSNSYVGVQAGYIGYAFSNAQLQPGFQAQSVQVPHLVTRFVLLGHEFGKYVSGQVSEIVPGHPVTYQNVNGDQADHQLWMNNLAAFTAKARLPLGRKWSLYGEGGLGVVTRNGFKISQSTALNSANYATFLYGGGLDYRLADNWDIVTGVIVAPGHAAGNQPGAEIVTGGFDYTMRRLPEEPAGADSVNGPIWPKNIVQFGYITDAPGFGVNNFFSNGKVSIFWHGTVEVANGASVSYRHNLFHSRRFFAIDWGADVSSWKSRKNGERFETASVYPALRIPMIRTNPVELYFSYSLAGPSLITRTNIDGQDTGKKFTFQDYMSVGYYLGRKRRLTGEIRIAHYSNANLFTQNPGITIPLGFYFGTSF